ncbi:TIGR01777 family oxidoreductase [Gracilibacillus caseinilyticus]|uniref:TIGR01777 family oxidoreductase n=1 Tax=Gracilibacillus caseinilyticus TaxID=2932256 RepID=A0ABY4EWP0_9BACI|nr:TIGR01777 family oxidoreductase [Gracilibacillus caseinilyticus]UOQ48831.1 TIGR01777 family oxidoreductase [Gracilibacillus caseinilyticus]
MNIVIAGGTGYVGKNLTTALTNNGHNVYILTRNPDQHHNQEKVTYIGWLNEEYQPEQQLPDIDAIVNLAGDSLFGYWTKTKKDKIFQSRINATYALIDLIKKMNTKPEVLINASAVGYFGTSQDQTFTEFSEEKGNDFLAEVTQAWEQTAVEARSYGVRTVIARLGVILGKEGALPLMAMPFRLFVGGKIGSGKQWVSWIHIDDVVGLILFAIHNKEVNKAFHLTSPQPVQNKALARTLGIVLHRPNWFPTPTFLLKTVLGDMSILVVDGQKVLPEKAMDLGYEFNFPTIEMALNKIYE